MIMNNARRRGFEKVAWAMEKQGFKMPERATRHSAGYDFYYNGDEDIDIYANGVSRLIPTGVKAYMQTDEVLHVYSRSSFGVKKDLILANSVGVIDADYYDADGEIMVKFRNVGKAVQIIHPGDRIAQGVFTKYLIADNDDVQAERTSGIGSSGK
jgi:dUTP pyrophosphatase